MNKLKNFILAVLATSAFITIKLNISFEFSPTTEIQIAVRE